MDGSHRHYARWKKPDINSAWFHFCKVQERTKPNDGDRSQKTQVTPGGIMD